MTDDAGSSWPSTGSSGKLDSQIKDLLAQQIPPDRIPVIVQTVDGLKATDRQLISSLGGKLLEDLWLIKGFSAELPPKAIETLALSDRIVAITYNTPLFR